MLIDRANCVCLADPRGNSQANGVFLGSNGTFSTDRKSLLAVPKPIEDADKFPEIKNGARAAAEIEKPMLVPTGMVEKIAKAIPKGMIQPLLKHAAVEISDGEIVVSVTDMEAAQTLRSKVEEPLQKYVNIERIIPNWDERPVRVVLDLERLRDLITGMISASRIRGQKTQFALLGLAETQVDRKSKQLIITMVGKAAEGITGVLMPIYMDHVPTDAPWHPVEAAPEESTSEVKTEPEADS